MSTIFIFLTLVCGVGFWVGLFAPNLALRFLAPEKRTRLRAVALYVCGVAVFGSIGGALTPPEEIERRAAEQKRKAEIQLAEMAAKKAADERATAALAAQKAESDRLKAEQVAAAAHAAAQVNAAPTPASVPVLGSAPGAPGPAMVIEKEPTDDAQGCKEDVSGKLGRMLDRLAGDVSKKTEVQQKSFVEDKEREFALAGYCGKVSGKVSDVGSGFHLGCEAPEGRSAFITLENIDGVTFRSAQIFFPEERLTEFQSLNKGDKVTWDVVVYGLDLSFNGWICAVPK